MHPHDSWLSQALETPLLEAIEALGLQHRENSFGPCPSCGAEIREKNRHRLPVGMTLDRKGWRCFACGEGGNVLSLVALLLIGTKSPGRGQWTPIKDWFSNRHCFRSIQPVNKRKEADKDPKAELAKEHFIKDVQSFWESPSLIKLSLDNTLSRSTINWLKNDRGFQKNHIANIVDQNILKLLAPKTPCPPWAHFGRYSWNEAGYDLIFPAYDSLGKICSLRARTLTKGKVPKSVAPKGEGIVATARACVIANDLGRLILELGKKPDWWPAGQALKVVIVEGEPDFLSWVGRSSDASEAPLAIFGIWSGAWTEDIGRRIPRGARVTIRTDRDKAGDEYARRIFRTISNHCTVLRAKGK